MWLLIGCGGPLADTASTTPVTGYDVTWSISPDPAVAGEPATFTWQVVDQLGRPIEDLQQTHERMVHVAFLSRDLEEFQHVHHEDYAELDVEDLREATFTFPLTLATTGDYRVVFDFAHQNVYQHVEDDFVTAGDVPQLDSPAIDTVTERVVDGLTVALTWDTAPRAGYEAAWSVEVTDAAGEPVTDVVQYLGADAHAVMVASDLGWLTHTHAWFPGMENTAPGHDMPHLYDGPSIPFKYVFPAAGDYKMWVQFARSDAPDAPYTVPFWFEVG